ncbi:MAG TPA: DUF3644 domain-containing protein [Candidatus Polarisedimenticolaceae bacterium]|nr:DUF3644 domain-containing protein [Candidatus Polarisedimenticolaceae bacterium]
MGRSARLFRKSEAALLAAIEGYNKPDSDYREEAFAVQLLAAWELLLQAKLVADAGNRLRPILVYETRPTRGGGRSKQAYPLRNRSGTVRTKPLDALIAALELPEPVRANLEAFAEIRAGAVPYARASPQLAKQVLELGSASIQNFAALVRRWFALEPSGDTLFLVPPRSGGSRRGAPAGDERKLVRYLGEVIAAAKFDSDPEFNVALEVSLSYTRAPSELPARVALSTDPHAPAVVLSEEDIRRTYPWDYGALVRRLRQRYADFKLTAQFHALRKPLLSDPRYVRTRYLDPTNPRSGKKDFYNPSIVGEFDRHYTRRSSPA